MKIFNEGGGMGADLSNKDSAISNVNDREKLASREDIKLSLEEISEIDDKERRSDLIVKHVEQVIKNFNQRWQEEGGIDDFQRNFYNLVDICGREDIDEALTQEQVDKIIDLYSEINDNYHKDDLKYSKGRVLGNVFLHNFSSKKASNYLAKSVAEFTETKRKFPAFMVDGLGQWAQNINLVEYKNKKKLYSALLDSPDKNAKECAVEILRGEGISGGQFMEQLFNDSQHDCSTRELLRIIEILESIYHTSQGSGFSGQEIPFDYLMKIKKNNDNYFIDKKLELIGNYTDFRARDKTMKLLRKYNDTPIEPKNDKESIYEDKISVSQYNLRGIKVQSSALSRISDKYGARYDGADVTSFFYLDDPSKKEIGLEEILEKELLYIKEADEEEKKSLIKNYQSLLNVVFRDSVESDFDMELKSYSLREQLQFVNFLSGKTIKEVSEVQEFVNQGSDKNFKNNRVKSFLSLEQDKNMGETILSIGEQLKEESEAADKIFSKYAVMVNGANQRADNLLKMYGEIFFKKSIDKNEVVNNILKQAKNLLSDAHENLKDTSKEKKKGVVENLINELDRIDGINNKAIGDIKATYIKLLDEKKKMISEMADDDPGLLLKNILGDYEKYETPEELNEAIESGEIETWWMDRKWLRVGAVKKEIDYLAQKADAHILGKMAETSKQKISEQDQSYKEYEILDDEGFREKTKGKEGYYATESKTYERHKEENQKRQDRVGRIENILAIQNNFESLFDSFALNKKVEFDEGDLSGKVMQKYQKLLERAKSTKSKFANIFKDDKGVSDEEVSRISDKLVLRAEGLLNDYVQKISETDESKRQEVLDEFVKKLERSSIEIDLLSSVLRSAKDDGKKIDLDIISGVGIDFKDKGEDFSEDAGEAEKIKKIIIEQSIEGRQKPGEAWEEVKKQAGILDTQEALDSIKKIKTYTLKYQGEIMGFIYFKPTHTDENGKTHYYASGLNVLKDLQGLNVGANFMKTTILEEANKDNQILDALTSIDKKVSSYYIENLPFVINGYKDDYKDAKPRFSITIDNSQEKKISGKTISKDIIRERAMEISHQQVIERMKMGEKTIYLKYDINGGDEKQFVNEVSRILPNRNDIGGNENEAVTEYCVSRYYDEKREDGVVYRYLVLENVS